MFANDPCMARSCDKSTKVSVYHRAKSAIWYLSFSTLKCQIADLAELASMQNLS